MKKPLLISLTAIAVISLTAATTLYAQTATGTSLIDKMKAVAHTFTLAGDLNPGQTGLTSEPVKGKTTGDILTAGEYNRLLELVSEGGGSSGGGRPIFYKCTNAQSLDSTNAPCYGASRNGGFGDGRYRVLSCQFTNAGYNYTMATTLTFSNNLNQNVWSLKFSDNYWILCNDGSVLVLDTQASAGSGGTGGSSYLKKYCRFTYAAPDFVNPNNSHMHVISVPDTWTSETCRSYVMATKWWAGQVKYLLGCLSDTGYSIGSNSSVNPTTANATIPSPNCGW
jgi:hypothetical protein